MKMRPRNSRRGFSLIEIVLALGVFSIAIVAILGLFPNALNTAQRSRQEAIATQIGRSILAALRGATFEKAALPVGVDASGKDLYNYLDLGATTPDPQTRSILFGANGRPVKQGGGGTGVGEPFLATVNIRRDNGNAALANVVVIVEFPAAAAPANRQKVYFATLISK